MINKLTRYIILEQIRPFIFFLGVMAGIIWLVKSLPSLEYVIQYNQSAIIFIQVIVYILPTVLLIVVPFAALAATSFMMNRLLSEAELITIMNSGLSNFRLVRPILIFSFLASFILFLLVFYIAPNSQINIRTIMHDASNNIHKKMMQIKKFYSPTSNINVFIGGLDKNDELQDIFITDERDDNLVISYSANSGNMVVNSSAVVLDLENGTIQNFNKREKSLILTNFNSLKLQFSNALASTTSPQFGPSEMSPTQMLKHAETLTGSESKKYIGEAHLRIALILTPVSLCIFSFSSFLLAGYNRRGYSILIFAIFSYGAVMQSVTFASKSLFLSDKINWQIIYLPSIATIIFGLLVIGWVSGIFKDITTSNRLIYK